MEKSALNLAPKMMKGSNISSRDCSISIDGETLQSLTIRRHTYGSPFSDPILETHVVPCSG